MSLNLNKEKINVDYYYSDGNGNTLGPFTLEELLPKISKDTLVYHKGINWTNAERIDELKNHFKNYDKPKKVVKGTLVIFGILLVVIALKYMMPIDFNKSKQTIEPVKVVQPSIENNSPKKIENKVVGKFPETSQRVLTAADIAGLSSYELKIMRNEIYARYGYIFKTKDMKAYFINQPWYSPKYQNVASFLSEIEKKNIELIKRYE